jgi:hypothetical protein
MRALLIAVSLILLTAGTAFAQSTACPTGQTYDQAQKKCVGGAAKSSSGY